jgi:predicted RNase H-like nuclease
MNAIGIDGCRRGWFFIQLLDSAQFNLGVTERLDTLRNAIITSDLTLIDIPIGLQSSGNEERACDRAARRLLGPRASSVFPVPCRQALSSEVYQEGSAINYRITGRKLSRQSWGIVRKIAETDRLIRKLPDRGKLREMHPEVCFRSLNLGQPMEHNKKKPLGQAERLTLLGRYLPQAHAIVDKARARWLKKDLATDDILDALVGAVSASHRETLISLPSTTERDEFGLNMEIVYSDPTKKDHQYDEIQSPPQIA